MIVLKHLAREFDMSPYKIRQILRAKYGNTARRRWQWEDDDKQLAEVRTHLASIHSSSSNTTSQPKPSPPSVRGPRRPKKT